MTFTKDEFMSQGYQNYEEKYNDIINRLKVLAKQCREFLEDGDGTLEYETYRSPKWAKYFMHVPTDLGRYTIRIELEANDEVIYIDGLDHYSKLLDHTIANWEKIGLEDQIKHDLENAKESKKEKQMENYIVINGKKAELTEEQLEKLGIKPEKKDYEDMFNLKHGESYQYIDAYDIVKTEHYLGDAFDNKLYAIGNYCKDEVIMKQRALHETLNRLLWRASVIAGEMDNECTWKDSTGKHFFITYNANFDVLSVDVRVTYRDIGTSYFPTEESAKEAIENIVKPFLKEHPEFVW